jgi:hypothetical protein
VEPINYLIQIDDSESGPVREINLEMLSSEAQQNDGTGTVSTSSERKGDSTESMSTPATTAMNGVEMGKQFIYSLFQALLNTFFIMFWKLLHYLFDAFLQILTTYKSPGV